MLLLSSDDGTVRLYDGQNYKFLKVLEGVGGEDVFWHPNEKYTILFTEENILNSYDVRTGRKTQVRTFPGYSFINTRGEGNLSTDGNSYAFVGQLYDSRAQEVKYIKLILFDLKLKTQVSELSLPKNTENFDWVSVSPSGNYVVIDYADNENEAFHGIEVFDRHFKRIWQKGLGAGHSDLAIDKDGNDVLIMDCYDPDKNITVIKKFRLDNGAETSLLEISPDFDLHISGRNEALRGWCLISTFNYTGRLTTDKSSWLPFENEIFLLKMDGSQEVKRLMHHYSRRYTSLTPDSDHSIYWAEPHATISRKADRILWGSNWKENVDKVESVDSYIGELNKD